MLYFLPEDSFHHISKGTVQFDEWISKEAEFPIAKLEDNQAIFTFYIKLVVTMPMKSM